MKLPRIIAKDWTRKLTALVLAVLIYGAVRMQLQTEDTYHDVEVFVTPKASDITVLVGQKMVTNIRVRGTKRSLDLIKSNPRIEHKVPEGTPSGDYNFRLRPSDVTLPSGVKVAADGIQPADFQVVIDSVKKNNVPIRLRLSREGLPPDRAIKHVRVIPPTADISGPSRYVKEIEEVVTQNITFDKNPPMVYNLNVALVDIPNIEIRPKTVRVEIELTRSQDMRAYKNIPIEVMTSEKSDLYVMDFLEVGNGKPTVSVTLEGPTSALDFLTADHSIRAFIELSEDDGVGTYNLPVRVWVHKKECQVQKHSPTSVKVRVGRRSKKAKR